MRKKTLTAILGALVLIATPAARAEIASKEYVDNQQENVKSVIAGDESHFELFNAEIINNGGLAYNTIKADGQDPYLLYGTDQYGQIIGYSKIGMRQLDLPTPGAECNNGCMLMVSRNNNGSMRYAWEPVMRDNNEAEYKQLTSTGFVDGQASLYNMTGYSIDPQE